MHDVEVEFEGKKYTAKYNEQNKYYEIDLKAPEIGGIYPISVKYTDLIGNIYEDEKDVQILVQEEKKTVTDKVIMWIFDWRDFSVKNIIEISDYEITIDEETNANSLITVLKKTKAKSNDIVIIKKNNTIIYEGIIGDIQNEDGKSKYEYTLKYITNLFDEDIELTNEELIKTIGLEDFIYKAIDMNFINNKDTFVNRKYLVVRVKSHSKKQTTVTNSENNIYNLHTWLTNCTQNYNITYTFNIEKVDDKYKLVMSIENKTSKRKLIDTKAQSIFNYTEVFETDVISKVKVLTSTNSLTLFLLNDRTTTSDATDKNRAFGKSKTIFTEKYEDAKQAALDVMKANSYNHNITFSLYERIIPIGTPVAIKTKESLIYDTYISSIKLTQKKSIEYQCGNIRTKFIEKLLKERRK